MARALASRLRQRIDIVRPTKVATGKGGYATTYPTIARGVPAEALGLTGSEAVVEKVLRGIAVYRITIRWRADLLPTDQLRYGARDLNIKSAVDPDGRRERMVIVCDTEGAQSTTGVTDTVTVDGG